MYLIVGGSGFVGTRLIEEMGVGNCLNLDKNSSPYYQDITVIDDIRTLSFEPEPNRYTHLVLLAAEHKDNITPKTLYHDVNVLGTKNILDMMDKVGIKNLVFTSSVAVYGLNKPNPDENYFIEPFNHYGKSKWGAENIIKEWYNRDPNKKSITIIRPSVIFGERNRGNVFNLLKQISSGNFMIIGNGKNKKSMAYVGNITAFIKDRIHKEESGYHVYNYADKPDLTMSELTFFIEKKMNLSISKIKIPYWLGILGGFGFDFLAFLMRKKLPISSIRVKKFCATTQFNATKAHSIFNPPFTLEEGLNKTLEYEFINSKQDNVIFDTE